VVSGEALVHQAIQRFAGLRAISSPPEPATVGFVQWTPEDWNVGVLETEKLVSNGVHITEEKGVVGAGGIGKCGRQVECCTIGIDAHPPWYGIIVDEITRS